jgi:hypothetical protein
VTTTTTFSSDAYVRGGCQGSEGARRSYVPLGVQDGLQVLLEDDVIRLGGAVQVLAHVHGPLSCIQTQSRGDVKRVQELTMMADRSQPFVHLCTRERDGLV